MNVIAQKNKGQAFALPALSIAQKSNSAFAHHRQACIALINSGHLFSRKEGQFLGGQAFDPGPLSERQSGWLDKLLVKAGLPPLIREV